MAIALVCHCVVSIVEVIKVAFVELDHALIANTSQKADTNEMTEN